MCDAGAELTVSEDICAFYDNATEVCSISMRSRPIKLILASKGINCSAVMPADVFLFLFCI